MCMRLAEKVDSSASSTGYHEPLGRVADLQSQTLSNNSLFSLRSKLLCCMLRSNSVNEGVGESQRAPQVAEVVGGSAARTVANL